ncbi:MAG: hypothetical protein WC141_01710 [Arcobacteraceae bacterium]
MKIGNLLIAGLLSVSLANAQDIMKQSMSIMEEGMVQIQQGFLNNNIQLIEKGSKRVNEGNSLFSNKELIVQYLPEDKKHLANHASNVSKRIALDVNVLTLNLEEKAFIKASNAYSDILNACSSCHAIVRNW